MTSLCKTFSLASPKGRQTDEALRQFFIAHDAVPVCVDVSGMAEITARTLQLLVSAQKERMAHGLPMTLAGVSDTFRDSLALLGVPAHFFDESTDP